MHGLSLVILSEQCSTAFRPNLEHDGNLDREAVNLTSYPMLLGGSVGWLFFPDTENSIVRVKKSALQLTIRSKPNH